MSENRRGDFFDSHCGVRHNFSTIRAARIWNDLPAGSTNFSSLNSFKCSLVSLRHF